MFITGVGLMVTAADITPRMELVKKLVATIGLTNFVLLTADVVWVDRIPSVVNETNF